MSDKILESGTVHVQDIQMGKKKMSDVKIANDEVLFIIFYQGRGIINAFGEEIFMSEKEYVMIQGATGRDKISVHAEYPQIMITFTGLSMSETIMRGCLKNQSMKIVSMLINEINEKQFGYIHNCESLINMLLILLHRERNQTSERLTDSERRNYCEKVNSYVQKHYLESPQMEFLANKFGYDKYPYGKPQTDEVARGSGNREYGCRRLREKLPNFSGVSFFRAGNSSNRVNAFHICVYVHRCAVPRYIALQHP